MTKRFLIAACLSALLMASADAQSPPDGSVRGLTGTFQPGLLQRQDGFVRIQSSTSFFLPGPTGEGDDAQKLRERARRMIYETAARECDLLRETLAKDCRLESVNSNVNVAQRYGQQQEGYNVNGSISLQITLK